MLQDLTESMCFLGMIAQSGVPSSKVDVKRKFTSIWMVWINSVCVNKYVNMVLQFHIYFSIYIMNFIGLRPFKLYRKQKKIVDNFNFFSQH